jgi:ORF6N domain
MKQTQLLPSELIERRILLIREQRVRIDTDLAVLYGVETKRLKEQVKRNSGRFPPDFMFELNAKEKMEVVANCDHLRKLKYSPYLPLVFSEHGVLMLANVINNPQRLK